MLGWLALYAAFPGHEETHALFDDGPSHLHYLMAFGAGWLLRVRPAATTPPSTAGRPNSPLAAMIGAIKAKLDARNTGTWRRVTSWNSRDRKSTRLNSSH